jgi:fatty acid amide hydrolase 2
VRSDPAVAPPAATATAHDPLCELPAVRIAELIRRRTVSSLEVVDAHIARIEAVNPAINAVIAERFADARREAREADARVARGGELPPLLGVPCTIKEFIGVAGMTWTAGLHCRRGRCADVDATVVTRVRDAGAIVLGMTNVPEGGMWMETYNTIYGRTNNPWDLTRTPGGSSGGEAAIVAAGGSVFGIGSDIAGSIRIPAGMCGVIGHKPSALLVPNTGQWAGTGSAAERILCTGPIGRCVRDVERVLEIIAGPDGASATDQVLGPIDPAHAAGDLRGVRVIPVTATGKVNIWPVMRDAVDRAAAALVARGAELVTIDPATWTRLFGQSLGVWMRGLAEAGSDAGFAELITEGSPLRLVPELIRILGGRPRFATATLGLVALERLSAPLEKYTLGKAPPVDEIRAGLDELLGPRGVIIHPPYSRPAPRHQRPLLTPFDAVCTALFSVTGMPGTVVPIGFDHRELPVAVQVISRRGNDRLTLAAARVLEDTFGGWTPAPVPELAKQATGNRQPATGNP